MAEPINWINKFKEKQESTKVDPTNIKARLFMDAPARGTKPLVKGSPEWYANASGKTETTMAPWEYLMALPENAIGDILFRGAGKLIGAGFRKFFGSKATELVSHLQGEDALKMFKDYKGLIPKDSPLGDRIIRYVPEARTKYGLVGNNKITDREIAESLYRHAAEFGKKTNTKATNTSGEPLLLFRGDTQAYTTLKPRVTPTELATQTGTMDNSLGNLFLGDLPNLSKGQGIERYLSRAQEYMGHNKLIGSGTGSKPILGEIDVAPNVISDATRRGGYLLSSGKTKRGDIITTHKLPAEMTSSGVNDINAFMINTSKVRNATDDISVLNDDFLAMQKHFKGNPGDESRSSIAKHYESLLSDAKANKEGLLRSNKNSKFRDEHDGFNYYALPNSNIQGAKHLLSYDLRKPVNLKDPNIFKTILSGTLLGSTQLQNKKEGGKIDWIKTYKDKK